MHLSLKDLGALKRSKNVEEALVHFVPVKPAGQPVVLGRADGCDLILRADGVSRRHAELRKELGNYLLVDMNSHNGTFINGNQLPPNEPTKVIDRQNVWLGAYRALFLYPEQIYNLATNLRKKL
jgi:pSer/pThr/pTyr-binding forkhead associated (FHA) protein